MTAPTRIPSAPPPPDVKPPSALSKQYGPLPLGAWIAVIGGALAIAWYTKRTGDTKKQIVEDTSGVPGVGTGAQSLWVQSSAPPTAVEGKFETNEEWARAAVNYLIAQGYDASLADTAVRKYLESTQLSISERALVTLALAKFGSPPIPLPAPPPLTDIPKPAEPPPPPPPPPPAPPAGNNYKWVVVTPWPTKTSTLWGIASLVYGNGSQWPTLYNANRVGVRRPDGSAGMIKNPNLIYAGWRIYCP